MYNINWTAEALADFEQNIYYLEEAFTEKEIITFINKTQQVINIIATNPKSFKQTKYKNTRSVPIMPQITLFYKIIDNENIDLLRFWNNYKDIINLF